MSNGSPAAGRCRATAAATTSRFAVERGADDAGAGPGPVGRVAAEQPHAQRRRDGRVGDPHLADRQHVDPRLDRHHAVGDGAGAFLLAHRRRLDDVGGRRVEVHLVDPQIGVDHPAQLVDRGAAGDEVLHHLRRDRGRIGRDAARRDAVIGGEHDGARDGRARAGGAPARSRARPPAPRAGRARRRAWSAGARGAAAVPASRSGPGRCASRARISSSAAAPDLGHRRITAAQRVAAARCSSCTTRRPAAFGGPADRVAAGEVGLADVGALWRAAPGREPHCRGSPRSSAASSRSCCRLSTDGADIEQQLRHLDLVAVGREMQRGVAELVLWFEVGAGLDQDRGDLQVAVRRRRSAARCGRSSSIWLGLCRRRPAGAPSPRRLPRRRARHCCNRPRTGPSRRGRRAASASSAASRRRQRPRQPRRNERSWHPHLLRCGRSRPASQSSAASIVSTARPRFGRRAPHHDDRQPELARRDQLGLGGGAAARLADQHVDRVAPQQLPLVGQAERPAPEHHLVKPQRQRLRAADRSAARQSCTPAAGAKAATDPAPTVSQARRPTRPTSSAAASMLSTSIQRSSGWRRHGGRSSSSRGTPARSAARRAAREISAANGCVASISRSMRCSTR